MTDKAQLATILADNLGFDVGESHHDRNIRLTRNDGAEIFLCLARGRFEVSGDYPRTDSGGYRSPYHWGVVAYDSKERSGNTITVSATRDPLDIVKEIKRRFLPRYLELFEACMIKRRQSDERHSVAKANFDVLREAGPTKARDAGGETLRWYDSTNGSGTVNAYTDSVSMELRGLPVETARQILAALRELHG